MLIILLHGFFVVYRLHFVSYNIIVNHTRSSAVAKRPRDASRLYIQNVERSLLLLVVSASDIPLRAIKFFSVLFSSAYSSMLQAVTTNIRWCVADCAIYTAWSSVTVFVTSHVSNLR